MFHTVLQGNTAPLCYEGAVQIIQISLFCIVYSAQAHSVSGWGSIPETVSDTTAGMQEVGQCRERLPREVATEPPRMGSRASLGNRTPPRHPPELSGIVVGQVHFSGSGHDRKYEPDPFYGSPLLYANVSSNSLSSVGNGALTSCSSPFLV